MEVSERWLPVVGYEGIYEVSDLGRVRSLDRTVTLYHPRGGRVTRSYKGKLLSPIVRRRGYVFINLKRQGQRAKQRPVHRLVLRAFVGPCPKEMECCHNNGNPGDNRLTNLRWDTHAANSLDSFNHGTAIYGERHHKAKLTVSDVKEIRRRLLAGETPDAIASDFPVKRRNIANIKSYKIWRHYA